MADPFALIGPASISFSGGRTSAYMLYRIVQAHGGVLPENIMVLFANTGKEREETLRFVYECGSRWSVKIHWVEWRKDAPGFEEVGFNSASRQGEPFEALIKSKQRLPNWQERWCTGFLKVTAMHRYLASTGLQIGAFSEVIGLRDDEGHRILPGLERAKKDGRHVVYPLAEAGITKPMVLAFWKDQPFDLGLKDGDGNCDVCFLKGKGLRKRIIRETPSAHKWWDRMEREQNGFFDRRDTIADLVAQVREEPDLFDPADPAEYDVECGDSCGGDSPIEISALQAIYERAKATA